MKKGTLTLVPTPLSETGKLDPITFDILNQAAHNNSHESIFVVEDQKPGRRRWIAFGLPRESIEHLYLYNEHNSKEGTKFLLNELLTGKSVYLMSDGGLPAFCDPGADLVRECHKNNIKVTSTPFHNSVILALALSGFSHKKFWFEGFLPIDQNPRRDQIKILLNKNHTSILMDTPYRLKRLLEEIQEVSKSISKTKLLFLALDLNTPNEQLLTGSPLELLSSISDFKREFILIISE